MESARSMLKAKGIPNNFWAESVACAIYLLNRASLKLQNQTPQEVWSGHKPSVVHLRVFSNIAYSHIPDERRKKLDDKFENASSWDIVNAPRHTYNSITKKLVISRYVKFNEEEV